MGGDLLSSLGNQPALVPVPGGALVIFPGVRATPKTKPGSLAPTLITRVRIP